MFNIKVDDSYPYIHLLCPRPLHSTTHSHFLPPPPAFLHCTSLRSVSFRKRRGGMIIIVLYSSNKDYFFPFNDLRAFILSLIIDSTESILKITSSLVNLSMTT